MRFAHTQKDAIRFDTFLVFASMSSMSIARSTLIGFLVTLGVFAVDAYSCVGCRTQGDTLGDPEKILQAGLAFSWSVLFMLVVVMGMISGLVWFLVRTCRAVDARHSSRTPLE